VDWFEGTAKVSSGRNGVLISRYVDGRATGDAFVLFDTEEEATKALKMNRELMGNRYIVLLPCPSVELKKVIMCVSSDLVCASCDLECASYNLWTVTMCC